MLYLQTSLEKLLPTWEAIVQQKEAIIFACGLSSKPNTLLQIIAERFISYMQSSDGKNKLPDISHVWENHRVSILSLHPTIIEKRAAEKEHSK